MTNNNASENSSSVPFDLLVPVGTGSKGQVWLARNPEHPSGVVALKLMHPGRVSLTGGQRWQSLGDHRNVVRVLDARWTGARPYIAMEYVEGPSLRVVLDMSRGTSIPLPVTMHIMRGVLSALALAHGRNPEPVIHGALSPDSILIDSRTGTAKVDDFGLGVSNGVPDTLRGRVMDRLRHLAPEQLAGSSPSEESDIYTAGILLHELLFGVGPFEHLPLLSLLSPSTRLTTFSSPTLPSGVPGGLLTVLRKALAGPRMERFSSARQMLESLQPYMPSWEVGADTVAQHARQLDRHAASALASLSAPASAPAEESEWQPFRPSGGDWGDGITAVSWTSRHRIPSQDEIITEKLPLPHQRGEAKA
jgi:serine/threonine protein kinase